MERVAMFFPRSMRFAISTSPSRVRSGTVPISRRYIRTGSLVFSMAPGVRSSSTSPCLPPMPAMPDALSSLYLSSDSTMSMPWFPNASKSSSRSSDVLTSEGSMSFTSS